MTDNSSLAEELGKDSPSLPMTIRAIITRGMEQREKTTIKPLLRHIVQPLGCPQIAFKFLNRQILLWLNKENWQR